MTVAAHTPAVLLRSVSFSYPRGPEILHIEELRIPRGESVFLHGPSGSGKTTLLSLISGVLQPSAGLVQVLSQNLSTLHPAARDTLRGERMGYIFQGFNLIPYLTVEENILLPCHLHAARRSRIQAATLSQEAARLAHRLDIHAHLHASVTQLSVGQQQRVAIARAVIGSPELLITDEPTSSLDADRGNAFLQLLMELTGESRVHGSPTTLLFVSHDRSLAAHFDRVVSIGDMHRAGRAMGPDDAV